MLLIGNFTQIILTPVAGGNHRINIQIGSFVGWGSHKINGQEGIQLIKDLFNEADFLRRMWKGRNGSTVRQGLGPVGVVDVIRQNDIVIEIESCLGMS